MQALLRNLDQRQQSAWQAHATCGASGDALLDDDYEAALDDREVSAEVAAHLRSVRESLGAALRGALAAPQRQDRSARVVLVANACCQAAGAAGPNPIPDLDEGAEEACYAARGAGRDSGASFMAALVRAAPHLRELGWDISVQGCGGMVDNAEFIIADAAVMPDLFSSHPKSLFVVMDTSAAGTLAPDLARAAAHPRILAVLKPAALADPAAHNGPLLAGASHLAHLPGAKDLPGYEAARQPALSALAAAKVRAMLSHAHRFRFPLACGGAPEDLRGGLPSYAAYIAALLDTKVVVSPYGAGEWAPGDLEALLCGCLLVKPRPAALAAYPPPLRAGHALVGTAADWHGIGGVLLDALEDLPAAQRIADRGALVLLEASDPRRYAADIDGLLGAEDDADGVDLGEDPGGEFADFQGETGREAG
ncbi:hypothetical protein WJX81_006252 [Elliptochloris bilobata]|uniref:Uncharacterized protein n=1 Tax=Elliptochloris bilobata TaxID=381761 RepID=A0AAW1S1L7_9CHLO